MRTRDRFAVANLLVALIACTALIKLSTDGGTPAAFLRRLTPEFINADV